MEVNGSRVKPAYSTSIDDQVQVRRGEDLRVVIVRELNAQRGSATRAQLMYEETAESVQIRETLSEQRKLERSEKQFSIKRPEGRERRSIRQFKRKE